MPLALGAVIIGGAVLAEVVKGVVASNMQDDVQAHEIEMTKLASADTARSDADSRADETAQREWDSREAAADRTHEDTLAVIESNTNSSYPQTYRTTTG